ncbi:MAG: hypothetical protein ABIA75_08225 [Candidatus Neomarinimicrobiota bacterium]
MNGLPIQSLTNIHTAIYVDYSQGIRFLDAEISVDDVTNSIQTVLKNPIAWFSSAIL